ncbi:DUF6602 domain-containing protein [Bacillus sp. FSL L8-0642]|uniref:DUF6602 domain-containing protein n=1 Tax=Bacillus sp. FSL L8-0642 TaxID=2921525 RepID=UPI0030FA4FCA
MIVTVSDFLQSLMEKEKELIKKYEIVGHAPTIGDMYEGLTAELLNKSLFKELDIRVAAGKIRNGEGEYSNEVDCMIVEGEGDKIPYTEKYIYDISQVIAVLEIKKNLYKNDLIDSYNKMHKIYKIGDQTKIELNGLRDAFRQIVKKELPNYEDIVSLPFHEQMIYHSLLMEETLPVRIIFGYYGYKSEFSLREAFYKFISDNMGNKGFSPVTFPDLIICGNSSLIKLDAMPYPGFIDDKNFWNFYASSKQNPLLLLLEVIWTRLSYKYKIDSSIFGDDLESETFHPFISGKAIEINGKMGWECRYKYISQENLNDDPIKFNWEPEELTEHEVFIINWLCQHGVLDVNRPIFQNMLSSQGLLLEDVILGLNEKGLTYFHNGEFRLLIDECQIVIVDGKWYAAENKTGRLKRWLMKKTKSNNKEE